MNKSYQSWKKKKRESVYTKLASLVFAFVLKYELKKNSLHSRWFEIIRLKLFAAH